MRELSRSGSGLGYQPTNMHTDDEGGNQNFNSGLVRSGMRQRYFVLRFLAGGAIRAVRHALKNCVGILTGGDACFDEKGCSGGNISRM